MFIFPTEAKSFYSLVAKTMKQKALKILCKVFAKLSVKIRNIFPWLYNSSNCSPFCCPQKPRNSLAVKGFSDNCFNFFFHFFCPVFYHCWRLSDYNVTRIWKDCLSWYAYFFSRCKNTPVFATENSVIYCIPNPLKMFLCCVPYIKTSDTIPMTRYLDWFFYFFHKTIRKKPQRFFSNCSKLSLYCW